jgi:hypothetical protein
LFALCIAGKGNHSRLFGATHPCALRQFPGRISAPLALGQSARSVGVRRLGIVATNARRTAFTDSALWNTRATSGSSSTASDPGRARPANRFGLAFV